MKFLKKSPNKQEIEDKINDIFMILAEDIIDEYNLVNLDYVDPQQEIPDDYWFYNGSYYKDFLVKDRITFSISSSIGRYHDILETIKDLKTRMEHITGLKINIDEVDVDIYKWPYGKKPKGRVTVKLEWKNINDKFNDFKKFISSFKK